MSWIDWVVLITAVLGIVVYGVWKGRGSKDLEGYLLSGRSMKWYTITLSIVATQASAITFLSTPGQAYVDGMRFVQFYFGLPIAMVLLSVTLVPLYHRLKVYTAYELLERRFDSKTRVLTAFLFLLQRGLAAGLTIYAPALILSVILRWPIGYTNFGVGILVIIYTAAGGTKAVSWTHFHQVLIIFTGLFITFGTILYLLPQGVGLLDATRVAGALGRLNVIDPTFDLSNRYTLWSGLLGGTFLALSYFGTDQSQVQRYLTARSLTQSRIGLLSNGLVKVPMQFFILFLGAMVFVFYQFTAPPIFFNPVATEQVMETESAGRFTTLEESYRQAHEEKQRQLLGFLDAADSGDAAAREAAKEQLQAAYGAQEQLRGEAIEVMRAADPDLDDNDSNYIFLTFVVNFLPVGLVGLLIAAILFASMSSTSAELNALAATTVVDLYRRLFKVDGDERHYLRASKLATVIWGAFAILFAQYLARLGTLVEAVNILGSIFYGAILGIFLLAFFARHLSGTAVFSAAVLAEITVVVLFNFTDIAYLWYNLIGCLLVAVIAFALDPLVRGRAA